jgi:hypothetical protein
MNINDYDIKYTMKAQKTVDVPMDLGQAIKAGLAPASLTAKYFPRPTIWDYLDIQVGNGAKDTKGGTAQ